MAAPEVVLLGGSAGGMRALQNVFQTLDDVGDSVVCVVLHRSPENSPLSDVLQRCTAIPVHEPGDSPWGCPPGAITVAPAGYHLLLGNSRTPLTEPPTPVAQYRTGPGVRAHLSLEAPVAFSRPSIDVTFRSAAELVNPVTAVLLTCANEDGAEGCAAVKAAGGRVLLQDPASCEASAAVTAAMRRVEPDYVADPLGIGRWLSRNLGRSPATRLP